MTPAEMALMEALRARGVTSPATFADRYGVALDGLTVAAALAILDAPAHPRARLRATDAAEREDAMYRNRVSAPELPPALR